MKVLCVGGKEAYRRIFAEAVIAGGETCDLTIFNPHIGGPKDLTERVENEGFDLIPHDFHADIDANYYRMELTRELNPDIPIVVFTDYSTAEAAIVEAKCAPINVRDRNIISKDGQTIVQEAVAQARHMVT